MGPNKPKGQMCGRKNVRQNRGKGRERKESQKYDGVIDNNNKRN